MPGAFDGTDAACAAAAGSGSTSSSAQSDGADRYWKIPGTEALDAYHEVQPSPPPTPMALQRHSTYDMLEEEGNIHPLLAEISANDRSAHVMRPPLPPGPVPESLQRTPAPPSSGASAKHQSDHWPLLLRSQAAPLRAEARAQLMPAGPLPVVTAADIRVGMHHCAADGQTGLQTLWWGVSASKLDATCRTVVSPDLTISLGASCPSASFRLMLQAAPSSDRKGGASFRKAAGWGFIQLKCEEQLQSRTFGSLRLQVSVGRAGLEPASWQKGPCILHDFGHHSICNLVPEHEPLNFRSVVDRSFDVFVVHLEVLAVS